MRRLLLVMALAGTALLGTPSTAQTAAPPNVILVVTDDQRWDTAAEMDRVQSDLVASGVDFTNARATTPLCCPSRASILTGQYTHTHGVWNNHGSRGGFPAFDDDVTLATVLRDTGYRTGLFGKYLNKYPDLDDPTYVPPGWDEWKGIMSDGADFYYEYDLNENGTIVHYGSQPEDYVTDVLFDHATQFAQRAIEDGVPFFAYVTPAAAHGNAVPEAEYEDDYADIPDWRPLSYNEHDVSDKPTYIQERGKISLSRREDLDDYRQRQYETLQSVDEDLGTLLDSLPPAQLANTLVIFTSDNGNFWGEHRLQGKNAPYQEALRVPMVLRWDDAFGAQVSDELAANIDLAPTIAQAAGTSMPDADGLSLLATAQTGSDLRDHHVIEGRGTSGPGGVPAWCGVQWRDFQYTRYATGEEEFYKLSVDPLQRGNRAAAMEAKGTLAKWRQVAMDECVPTPPSFSW
jgi:N-acetylglucosamine-6-sulfatase